MKTLLILASVLSVATSCRTSKNIHREAEHSDSTHTEQLHATTVATGDSTGARNEHQLDSNSLTRTWEREIVIEDFAPEVDSPFKQDSSPIKPQGTLLRKTTIREHGTEKQDRKTTTERTDSSAKKNSLQQDVSQHSSTAVATDRSSTDKHKESAPFDFPWAWMCGFVFLLLLFLIAWRRLKKNTQSTTPSTTAGPETHTLSPGSAADNETILDR